MAELLGLAHTNGIDWIRWGISFLASMASIAAYMVIRARNTMHNNTRALFTKHS